jgi:hypothetical protein
VRSMQRFKVERILPMKDFFFQSTFTNIMPTSGLCRVVESWLFFERIFRPPAIAHAA